MRDGGIRPLRARPRWFLARQDVPGAGKNDSNTVKNADDGRPAAVTLLLVITPEQDRTDTETTGIAARRLSRPRIAADAGFMARS